MCWMTIYEGIAGNQIPTCWIKFRRVWYSDCRDGSWMSVDTIYEDMTIYAKVRNYITEIMAAQSVRNSGSKHAKHDRASDDGHVNRWRHYVIIFYCIPNNPHLFRNIHYKKKCRLTPSASCTWYTTFTANHKTKSTDSAPLQKVL